MIDPGQFRSLVIRPTLQALDLSSLAAERLLLGTAIAESGLRHLKQIRGPALGLYQMEPATHDDLWNSYLFRKPELAALIGGLVCAHGPPPADHLIWNLRYATAMARLLYWRRPEPLPPADDIEANAAYWLAHYNTPQGKGTRAHFLAAVTPHWQTPAFRDPD